MHKEINMHKHVIISHCITVYTCTILISTLMSPKIAALTQVDYQVTTLTGTNNLLTTAWSSCLHNGGCEHDPLYLSCPSLRNSSIGDIYP